jgi:hypothetical protein
MNQQTISTSLAPEIIIDQVGGNLQIKGWERPEVLVRANPSELRLEEQDDQIRISCEADLELRLPGGATVQVATTHGEARIRLLDDQLHIHTVHGSLYLRGIADTEVENVHGELMARQVTGGLKVNQVHGNATIRAVQGACVMEHIMGNLDLRDVEGDLRLNVDGNVRLRLSSLGGGQYEVRCEGNLHCRLPESASLQLNLTSDGETISLALPDRSQVIRQSSYQTTLGDGQAIMSLSAGGSIFLSARDSGETEEEPAGEFGGYTRLPDDFGEQIARQVEAQVEAQLEMMNRQLNAQMAAMSASFSGYGLSPEETERIMSRARERSERASARAEEKMRRAQEKIDRKMEEARRRAETAEQRSYRQGRKGWTFEFPKASTPPPSPKEPVSDEERLMILRMLEQKKISLEEAEQLLSALEGKDR